MNKSVIIITLSILGFAVTLNVISWPTEERIIKSLEKAGFTEIKLGESNFFGCSRDDQVRRKFSAKDYKGNATEGTVCCGLNGCYARY